MVKQAPGARAAYSFSVPCRAVLCCLVLALSPPFAGAAELQVRQDYLWPDEGAVRWRFQDGGLLAVARWDPAAQPPPVLGISLPWMRCGPLLPRGMLRQVSDPLGFSAWSGVFQERTALALDAGLSSPGTGVLLLPLPDCGVFCRPVRAGVIEYGAFGGIPLGAGAAAEGAFFASQPPPQSTPDDWFLPRSVFPGGDVMHLCSRLLLRSPSLGFSFMTAVSSARWAGPGAFSNLLISAQTPWMQAAVLFAGVTPAWRAPDGTCSTEALRFSAMLRLGNERGTGSLEAGWSFTAARPGFSPGDEIPTRTIARVELARDFESLSGPPLSLVVDAEKDISRALDGSRSESARCGTTLCAGFAGFDITAGVRLSLLEGLRVHCALNLKPSSRLRILVEGRGDQLAALSPAGSLTAKVSFERGGQRASVQAGFEGVPLGSGDFLIARHLRLSLSCSTRRES